MRRSSSIFGVISAVMAGWISACAPPIPSGGFDSPDPASRIYAAVGVAEQFEKDGVRPDVATLENLIRLLNSSDPAARLVAGDTLRLVTGVNLGFQASAPLSERMVATQRWVRWVKALASPSNPEETT